MLKQQQSESDDPVYSPSLEGLEAEQPPVKVQSPTVAETEQVSDVLTAEEEAEADSKYQDYKQKIWEIQSQSYQQSDNLIITISSGVLALSVSFLGSFFGKHQMVAIGYLIAGWVGLGLAISSVLLSYYVARKSHSSLLDEYASYLYKPSERKKLRESKNPWREATEKINMISALGLGLGIIFIIIFASLNALGGNSTWQISP